MPTFTSSRSYRRTSQVCVNPVRRHVAATVFCALTVTGCASFQGHQLPPVQSLQPPSAETRKPSAAVSLHVYAEKPSTGSSDFMQGELDMLRGLLDAFEKSGQFSRVSSGGQGELNIAVQVIAARTSSLPLKLLSLVSLFIIPSFETDQYRVSAKVTLDDGTSRNYTLTDTVTTVYGLLLLPVGFFKDPSQVTEQFRMNIWKNLILKMQQDGLLSVKAHRLSEVLPPVETLIIAKPRGTG